MKTQEAQHEETESLKLRRKPRNGVWGTRYSYLVDDPDKTEWGGVETDYTTDIEQAIHDRSNI